MSALDAALKIGALGMGGVFGFMILFYVAIRLIDFWYPWREGHEEER